MRILICPMPFKGTLSAREAGLRLARSLRRASPAARLEILPFADGGEGTAEALAAGLGGRWRTSRFTGPMGRSVRARWLRAPARRAAAIDAAAVCGLTLVMPRRRDPMRATSRGLGEWIAAEIDAGARELWIGLGGSATVEGGTGAAAALGVRFLDARGRPLPDGGGSLSRIARIDVSGIDPRLKRVRIRLLCDVRSPLSGTAGAARMFGPQKGATPAQVRALEKGLAHLARLVSRVREENPLVLTLRQAQGSKDERIDRIAGMGAAGGMPVCLAGLLGATVEPGAPRVAEALRLSRRIRTADLVVTGEGKLDAQTLQGKGIAEICRLARVAGKPVVAVVGRNDLAERRWRRLGLSSVRLLSELSGRSGSGVRRGAVLAPVARPRGVWSFDCVPPR